MFLYNAMFVFDTKFVFLYFEQIKKDSECKRKCQAFGS